MASRAAAHGATAEQMTAWCGLFEGCQRIDALTPRQPHTVLGVIQRLRLVPGESIEAVISDGTGRLRAIFTGEPIAGLELGQGMRLEGTVCVEGGLPLMRNPAWRLVRDPWACQEAHVGQRAREAAAAAGILSQAPAGRQLSRSGPRGRR